MNRKALVLITFAAFTLVSVAPAMAADPGFYITAALGRAKEDPKSNGLNFGIGFPDLIAIVHVDPDQVDADKSGVAWSIALGYQINRYFAAEVEYIDFSTTDISEHYNVDLSPISGPFEFTHKYASKVTGPAVSLLGSVPVGKGFDVFLRAGVLFADRVLEIPRSTGLDDQFGTTVWLGGVGVNWSFATRWAIRAEYQRTGKLEENFLAGETELERLSLSALFRL